MDHTINNARTVCRIRKFAFSYNALLCLFFVVFALDCMVTVARAQDVATPGNAPVETGRTFQLQVIHRDTKEPIPQAALTIRINNDEERLELTDAEGRYTVALPEEELTYFRVTVRKMDMVPIQIAWRPASEHVQVPDQYTLALEPGTKIGGIIQDEEGNPIQGVTVYLLAPGSGLERPAIRDEVAVTNEEGRWGCGIMPSKLDDIWIRLEHAEYVSDVMYGSTPKPPMEKLRDMTGVMVMKRGFEVIGTVVDQNGQPILAASVVQGADRWGTHYPETSTDGNGTFRFSSSRGGEMVLTAQKSGYAPELKVIQVAEGLEPVEFVLKPGNAIKGKVVDVDGNPLAEVPIAADTWRDYRTINWHGRTDEDGLFEWNGAPEDAVLFDFYPRGYMSVRKFSMTPSEEEYVITMHPPLNITGTVIDAETKEPIEKFNLLTGTQWSGQRAPHWQRNQAKAFTNGRYEVTFSYPYDGHFVRVEADGYFPAISRAFKSDEGEQTFDFELEKGVGPNGIILSPEGKPVANAQVGLAVPGQNIYISNGKIGNARDSLIVTSDLDGRFSMPPQVGLYTIVVLHDQGYAEVTKEELEADPKITLRPWARVEGKLLIGATPGANESIALYFSHIYNQDIPQISWGISTQTNVDGSFTIERVPAGDARVCRNIRRENGSSYTHDVPLDLKDGETAEVTIGGTGCPVIGRVVLPPESNIKVDWGASYNSLSLQVPQPERPEEVARMTPEERRAWRQEWMNTEEYKAYQKAQKQYAVILEEDGSFRVEDVPAGKYMLRIHANKPAGRMSRGETIGSLTHEFEIPEMPGGRSDEPFDLGTLELKLRE